MKMPLALSLAVVLLAACATGAVGENRAEHSIRLDETVESRGLSVTFVRVERDNRCPRDVQCIVGGEAVVAFALRTQKAKVELTFEFGAEGERRRTFNDYEIEVTAVDPHPVAGQSIAPEDYVVTFAVETRDDD